MNIKSGRFIVVEGLEGAGKSTALAVIRDILSAHVSELVTTREPGGTPVGEVIRRLVKESPGPIDARAELLLFYAARVQLVEQVIRPALLRGAWILADRFELSTFAYQGGGRKLPCDMIQHLSSFCLGGLKPDLTLFLDVTPEQGLQRVMNRGAKDRIELESLAFFNDVYQSYQEHIQTMDNITVIDAGREEAEVELQIRNTLQRYMVDHGF